MTNTTEAQKALKAFTPAQRAAWIINRLASRNTRSTRTVANPVDNGSVRIISDSVGEASQLLDQANRVIANQLGEEFTYIHPWYEVRFRHTNIIGAYPNRASRHEYAPVEISHNGAITALSSDELIHSWRYECKSCGAAPLGDHLRRCASKRFYTKVH